MKTFPWWTEEQKAYQKQVRDFARRVAPIDAKTRWTREFNFEILQMIADEGLIRGAVPKEYGGLGLGCTGGCIFSEEIHALMPGVARMAVGYLIGGLNQILEAGTEEQKQRLIPPILNGEISAIVITEMTAGTDSSGMTLEARKEGDKYILNGKKRFIVGAGAADRYFVYARTSNDPDVVKKHKHLTAFVVEKGAPGFTTEKINEIMGFENVQNGSLDFHDVVISEADRIGAEGDGWKIMMGGLNYERTLIAASLCGWQRLALNYVVPYTQRRVQFGKTTADMTTNQDKIANIVMRLEMLRTNLYTTAYMWDLGYDTTIAATTLKALGADLCLKSGEEATQIMGGDGVNRFYPVQNVFELGKTDHIAGGTVEACLMVIYRQVLKSKEWAEDLEWIRRVTDPELGVPIPQYFDVEDKKAPTEENILSVLADDYKVNPALHMKLADILWYIEGTEEDLVPALESLAAQDLVMLMRDRKGKITLAKATYKGLDKANDPEYYRWFPDYVAKDERRY